MPKGVGCKSSKFFNAIVYRLK